MKNIHDVMRQKELEIERLTKEIEALRIVVPIWQDQVNDAGSDLFCAAEQRIAIRASNRRHRSYFINRAKWHAVVSSIWKDSRIANGVVPPPCGARLAPNEQMRVD